MLKEEETLELEKIIKKENNSMIIIFFIIFSIFILFISMGKYFKNAKLDIIAETEGIVIPSSKVKSIQHLEGGIVKDILIETGSKVIKGQKLIIMETTESQANISELDQRLANLSVEIIRLNAEANNKKPVYSNSKRW